MNHITILREKNEKSKKLLHMFINSISIETIIIKAFVSVVEIENYRSFVDEIF